MTEWRLKPPTIFDRLRRFFRLAWQGVNQAWRDSFKVTDSDWYGWWRRDKPEYEVRTDGLYRVRQRFTIDNEVWRGYSQNFHFDEDTGFMVADDESPANTDCGFTKALSQTLDECLDAERKREQNYYDSPEWKAKTSELWGEG